MIEAGIRVLAPTKAEARTALGRLFPEPGAYILKGPTGRRFEVAIHGHAKHAADPLTLWREFFPTGGTYTIATADEFAKAVALTPGVVFEEWFLERLVEEAQRNGASVRGLIERVIVDFLAAHGGDLHQATQLARFEELLFDLRQGIRWSVANPVTPSVEWALRSLGFSDRDVLDFPGIAYRLGLIDEALRASGTRFTWPHVLELAARVPLLHSDEVAIAAARTRAGTYLTPVLLRDGQVAHAAALGRERDLLRTLTAEAVRTEMSPRVFASQLYHQIGEPEGLQRDWLRVARTEIAQVRLEGAFEAERRLRQWTAETKIFRLTAANPCSTCLRLYKNPDGTPKLYTVAEVERASAEGPNHGPQATWGPRLGCTHPQELCGPWATWSPALAGFFTARAPKVRQMMEQRGLT